MPDTIPKDVKMSAVAIKAYYRVAMLWSLSAKEAAALADMTQTEWQAAQSPDFSGTLTENQLLQISASINIYQSLEKYFSETIARQWFTNPNTGPLFDGARPIDAATQGGLSKLIEILDYIESLLGR